MEHKRIITIAGKLGSGKSSTANRIAEQLGYTRASTGDFMRSIAKERGVSLEELSQIAEKDPSIDEALDNHNRDIGMKENIILDSRLGFYFVPESFKVFLELDPTVAAERILSDAKINPNRNNETRQGFDTPENIITAIEERLASERKRYFELYGISDHTKESNFDLVINTATMPLEQVAQTIVDQYKKWLTR